MHVIGIDVSKRKLHAGWLLCASSEKIKPKATANSPEGVQTLLAWAQRHTGAEPGAMHFILEATSVYHEPVAEALVDAGAVVSVVNPLQVRRFAQSRGIDSKTDAHDRRVLALFGYHHRPQAWQPPPPEAKHLQTLLRRLEAVEADLQRERNRLETAEIQGNAEVLRSHQIVIDSLDAEVRRLREEIDRHIDRHPHLKDQRELLASVPGIGEVAARYLTSLFSAHTFDCAAQAAAYLGLTPKRYQSGTLERPARLSKTGDARARAKLYWPAIAALRSNPHIQAMAKRLQRAGKAPMAIIAAAMRKLIHIAFGVLKHQTPYDPQWA